MTFLKEMFGIELSFLKQYPVYSRIVNLTPICKKKDTKLNIKKTNKWFCGQEGYNRKK